MLHFTHFVLQKGRLLSYKLFAWTYVGSDYQDMDVHYPHTATKLKMISLYDLMLHPFKHNVNCAVMDSMAKKVRADSDRQPFSPFTPHGQGQVHTGTPRTPTSTIGANGLYKRKDTFRR